MFHVARIFGADLYSYESYYMWEGEDLSGVPDIFELSIADKYVDIDWISDGGGFNASFYDTFLFSYYFDMGNYSGLGALTFDHNSQLGDLSILMRL